MSSASQEDNSSNRKRSESKAIFKNMFKRSRSQSIASSSRSLGFRKVSAPSQMDNSPKRSPSDNFSINTDYGNSVLNLPPINSVRSNNQNGDSYHQKHRVGSIYSTETNNSNLQEFPILSNGKPKARGRVNVTESVNRPVAHPTTDSSRHSANSSCAPSLAHSSYMKAKKDMESVKSKSSDVSAEKSGFLSTIISVAKNAGSHLVNITSNDAYSDTSIQSEEYPNIESQKSDHRMRDNVPYGANIDRMLSDEHSSLTNIQFRPLKVESPLVTLGKGSLSLELFDKVLQHPNTIQKHGSLSSSAYNRTERPTSSQPLEDTNLYLPARSRSPNRRNSNSLNRSSANMDTKSLNSDRKTRVNGGQSLTGNIGQEDYAHRLHYKQQHSLPHRRKSLKGITYASERRQQEFHNIFKTISQDEKLIEDYSCALQKELLVQGKLYISEAHICFYSKLLGFQTAVIIPISEVVQISKKVTALLFPNGIVIQTLHTKHIFATFLTRDITFDLLTNVWNQVVHDQMSRPKTSDIYSDSDITTDDDLSTEEEYVSDGSISDEDGNSEEDYNSSDDNVSETSSNSTQGNSLLKRNTTGPPQDTTEKLETPTDSQWNGFPSVGAVSHPETKPGYDKQATDTIVVDDTISAPLGVVFLLLVDPKFNEQILSKQKNFNIQSISAFDSNNPTKRNYSYIKPLNGPVGPKQTKCVVTEMVEDFDLNSCIHIIQTTQTPDVPSGNSFLVKTNIFLTWGKNSSTNLNVLTSIEWSGKSWVKGVIEKSSISGQTEYWKFVVNELKHTLASSAKDRPVRQKRSRSRKSVQKLEDELLSEDLSLGSTHAWLSPIRKVVDLIPETLRVYVAIIIVAGVIMIACPKMGNVNIKINETGNGLRQIKIDSTEYILLPTLDNLSPDSSLYAEKEEDLWRWIESINHRVDGDKMENINIKKLQLKEMIRIMEMKLEKLKYSVEIK
ncbi:hypothetical protein LJB42_004166 [Komagataella kurtzmanii]|nr:hypothetical protein LJB42_004166 [Komagataella kurtzmanii]